MRTEPEQGPGGSASPVIVVVGAGPGIGLAVAHRFAAEGFAVGLVARDAARLEAALGGLTAAGAPRTVPAAADIGDRDALVAALAALRVALGEPDVVVFNASMFVPGAPTAADYDEVATGLRVGALGALVAIQDAAPAMVEAGRGTILVTGGGLGLVPSNWSSGLSMQKTAVRALAILAAEELAPAGVHVGLVTVDGVVGRGERFTSEAIAERYWELHEQTGSLPPEQWTTELVHH